MPPSLAVVVAARLLLSKSDAPFSECEDSIAVDGELLRFAVADGATEGFDSRRWARYLTRAWISPTSVPLAPCDLVERIRALGARLERRRAGRSLPWYLEEKASGGAYAAFLGLQVTSSWTWSAVALGDTCLIIERNGAVELAFPISSAEDFSSRPVLVASKTDAGMTRQAMRLEEGVCLPGDVLLLMSDAIACWYLGRAVTDRRLIDEFHDALGDSAVFTSFIERERSAHRLRNDDVAVVKLVVNLRPGDGT